MAQFRLAAAGNPSSREVIPVATFERHTRPQTPGFWSRYRWLIVTAIVVAIAVVVVLLVAYSGGGGGGGGGGGY
jgi:hypothetical protein